MARKAKRPRKSARQDAPSNPNPPLPDYSSPRWQAEQESLRRLRDSPYWQAELARAQRIAEALRAAKVVPPRPRRPTAAKPERERGAKRKLSDEVVKRGKKFFRGQLDADPGWASNFQACCVLVRNTLKLTCHWQTVGRWIVEPVLIERRRRPVYSYGKVDRK